MRLNSVLVPTLLLASVALAGNSPKIAQNDAWGGGSWEREADITKWIAGRFSLPLLIGIPPMGINIIVAFGGINCGTFVFKAGITATVGGFFYAWGGWHSEPESATLAPSSFRMSILDDIGIALRRHTSTSGVIAIINFSTEQVWSRFAHGDAMDCNWQADANWFVTPVSGLVGFLPIPDFFALAFLKLEVKDHTTPGTFELTSSYLMHPHDGSPASYVMSTSYFILLVYIPPPEAE